MRRTFARNGEAHFRSQIQETIWERLLQTRRLECTKVKQALAPASAITVSWLRGGGVPISRELEKPPSLCNRGSDPGRSTIAANELNGASLPLERDRTKANQSYLLPSECLKGNSRADLEILAN